MSIALGLLAGGWGLLKRIPAWLWLALAVALLVFGSIRIARDQLSSAYKEGRTLGATEATSQFQEAQEKADDIARNMAAQAVAKQDVISKGSAHAFDQVSDDIDNRAAAIGLRHDTAVAAALHRRAASGFDPNAVPLATDQPPEAPPTDCVPFPVALPAFTEAERNTAQLSALIDWYEKQNAAVTK